MRLILASVCALFLLSGCGRAPSESKTAAIQTSQRGGPSLPRTETPTAPNSEPKAGTKTDPGPAAKQEPPSDRSGPTFSTDDPQQTLAWLIRSAAKVRATPPGDQAALDREWQNFKSTLKSATGRTIRWEVPVRSVSVKQMRPVGVVADIVKSDADPACTGLRLKPDQQPTGFTTYILKLPTKSAPSTLRSGSRVLVTGTVARIETTLHKSRPDAPAYSFSIRLAEYSLTPVD